MKKVCPGGFDHNEPLLVHPHYPPDAICDACQRRNDEHYTLVAFQSENPPIDPWARIRELEAAIEQIEWCQGVELYEWGVRDRVCPMCHRTKVGKHKPECPVGRALGREECAE